MKKEGQVFCYLKAIFLENQLRLRLNKGVRARQRETGIQTRPWKSKRRAVLLPFVVSDKLQWTSESAST